jgi:transcriptional regulator with XRE-family HTH domain
MADLKLKRVTAGISGSVLCAKAKISRSRLSLIERGYTTPAPEEAARLSAVLDELIRAKSVIDQVAASVGWPTGERSDQ